MGPIWPSLEWKAMESWCLYSSDPNKNNIGQKRMIGLQSMPRFMLIPHGLILGCRKNTMKIIHPRVHPIWALFAFTLYFGLKLKWPVEVEDIGKLPTILEESMNYASHSWRREPKDTITRTEGAERVIVPCRYRMPSFMLVPHRRILRWMSFIRHVHRIWTLQSVGLHSVKTKWGGFYFATLSRELKSNAR